MARRLLVSDGTLSQEAQPLAFKIAVGGVVKQILKASCVENGIVRQFWPPQAGADDPRILWTTSAITVTDSVADPANASAEIVFTRSTGGFSYRNYPNADGTGQYLSPALDGTAGDDDKYLIRVDQVSGTALTGTLATWIDLNSAASFAWSLDQPIVGTLSAAANITIAQDDGLGAPVAGTSVVKTVSFSAEVRDENKIVWNETQHDLIEIKESVDATCDLIFNPSGFAIGDADTSGSFNEAWHVDSPNVLINDIIDRFANTIVDRFGNTIVSRSDEFTVKVVLVSGTAPTGSDLGVELSLDALHQWTLSATSGENLSNALDVTVSDGVTPITKRITMNSQRTEAATSNVWTANPQWELTEDSGSGTNTAVIIMGDDGVGHGYEGGVLDDSQIWHSETPTPSDLENYEIMLDTQAGFAGGITGSSINTWIRMDGGDLTWTFTWSATAFRDWYPLIRVRRIGDISIDKLCVIELGAEDLGDLS